MNPRAPHLLSGFSLRFLVAPLRKNVTKLAVLILFLVLASVPLQAQPPVSTLGPEAQVSVLTCSPGTELYSIFGHSALRIQDPATKLDWVWNYGVFEFDTPNFVLKFAQGKLLYYVLSYSYRHFYKEYLNEKRSIYEQTLDLTEMQKKAIFDALLVNELPDNRYYQYDFFYDNCSTRERDLVTKALGKDLKFHPPQPDNFGTYRQLIDKYLRNDVWADFGIDLLLGSPTDKVADQKGAMFLPDYLHQALSTAEVQVDGQWKPLVKSAQTLLQIPAPKRVSFQYGPHILGWSFLALAILFTFLGYRKRINLRGFDVLLFSVLGLLGILMLLFWVGTDHQATYVNLNMLWAFPLHLVFAFSVLMRRFDNFNRRYALALLIWTALFLATGWLMPQSFHAATFPLTIAALVRLAWNWNIRRTKAA